MSGTYDRGGRTIVDGTRRDNAQNNLRLGTTLALPVNKNNSIKFYASDDVRTSKGTIDFYLVGVVWQYRWGNGL